ncbi:DUF2267 domain-containing protein [Myxococcota bacterium]|nr:DUF2267 domain-containing protein [Myxococcota bacterium]
MTTTGLDVFDTTINRTNIWLKEIMEELATDDRHRAYVALRATLHALRDRLTPDSAAALGAQLPMLVRGLFFEGYSPSGKPIRARHKEDFLLMVRSRIQGHVAHDLDVEDAVRAVFRVLGHQVSEGETDKLRYALPNELRELWALPV